MSIDVRDTLSVNAPTSAQLPELRALWKEAFGDTDEFLDLFFATAYAPERCRCVTDGKNVAAALYLFDCHCGNQRLAYIYAVATRVSHRGKGICRVLMEDTHRYLLNRGYDGAVLVPSQKTLFDFYGKIGYRTCSEICEFHTCIGGESIEICRIDSAEYAALRRSFLPEGGVVQENENIDLLATYARFYAGDGFVLAASKSGSELRGVELLGNTSAAPSILGALGCTEGFFRTSPGAASSDAQNRPFAMYFPLNTVSTPPKYFGLAFD